MIFNHRGWIDVLANLEVGYLKMALLRLVVDLNKNKTHHLFGGSCYFIAIDPL